MAERSLDPDARYARGEISRDEWMRLKGPVHTGGPPPTAQARPPSPGRPGLALFAVVVVLVVVVVALAAFWWSSQSGLAGWSPSYAQPSQLQASDLANLNASATPGHAFMGNNTLWFGSGAMTLVVYGSPASHDMGFVIQGMVNPTMHIPAGTRMTVTMVNMDSGEYHTWTLTGQAPPYGSSGMMGGGMMSGTMMGTSSLAPMSSMGMWSQRMGLTAQAGTYWYVCTVSDHAASGMYGQIVVG